MVKTNVFEVKLTQKAEMHPLIDEEPWRSEEVRWKKIKNYLIYF